MDKPTFISNLQLLNDVLRFQAPLGQRYILCGGLLLGYMREADVIEHDCADADFFLSWRDEEMLLQSVQALKNNGFVPMYSWKNNAGETCEYTFVKDEQKFEFFIYRAVPKLTMNFWWDWTTFSFAPDTQLARRVSGQNLQIITFLDRQWLAPTDIRLYLHEQYGDWRTPNKEYNYVESPCNIAKYPWTERRSWE